MDISNTQSDEQMNKPGERIIPLTRWNDYHSWPPIGGLRHLVFFEDRNGFNKVVIRAGRRVLLDEREFFIWARKQQKES